jgi:catechol 2,3-dioxygenase-like lactoylglutathione lyase family enzyme
MLDHVSIQCADVERSKAFYDTVLATIGGTRLMDFGDDVGYGVEAPCFWLGPQRSGDGFRETHIAFRAPSRDAVDAFQQAATDVGMEVLHAARVWPEYHPGYYGAFVRDPDGNNVEAVHHTIEP